MKNRVYLDYAATTPVHPLVRQAMLEALNGTYGNPSSMHWAGKEAVELVGRARSQVAENLGCDPVEIHFTSGATEADNLALLGVLRSRMPERCHLITTAIEHHAILHAARYLEGEGHPVTVLPVDSRGRVDPEDVRQAIRPDTALVSVMLVNNEVGTLQPLTEIGEITRQAGVLLHSDAVQGAGLLALDVDRLKVDLLSLSAHKIYGPKGVGALYIREGVQCASLLHGGSQEAGLRPGTENVPGIAGLGAAMQLVGECKSGEFERISGLRRMLLDGLQERLPRVEVNGAGVDGSPHILSVSFPGADAEAMLLRLNEAGFAVSMGSACNSRSIEPSHVLSAMGLPQERIEATLRISFGYSTTVEDITSFLNVIPDVFQRARVM